MGFPWFTTGIPTDMEILSGQCILSRSASYSRIPPYNSISLGSTTSSMQKTLPSDVSEVFFSEIAYIGAYDTSFYFVNDSGTVLTKIQLVRTASVKVYLGNGTTLLVTSPFPLNTITQIEAQLKVSSSTGIFRVWVNGILIVDFSGDTGVGLIHTAFWGQDGGNLVYISDIILDTKRIGNTRLVALTLRGAGDANADYFYEYIGGRTNGSYSTGTAGRTTVSTQTFPVSGTVKSISLYEGIAGNFKVGILTQNSLTSYTMKYVSDLITSASIGEKTLVAGVDFPDNWTVTTSDTVCFYSATGSLANAASSTSASDENTGLYVAYYLASDGTVDQTAKTYSSTPYPPCIRAVILSDTVTPAYAITNSTTRDFPAYPRNISRYVELASTGSQLLAKLQSVSIPHSGVSSIRVSSQDVAGLSLANGNHRLKIGTDDLSSAVVLPTNATIITSQFDGNWTPEQLKTAQIGIQALT